MEKSNINPSHTPAEQIKYVNRIQPKLKTIENLHTKFQKLWNESPKEIAPYKDILFQFFLALQYDPAINKSALFLLYMSGRIFPITSSADFIHHLSKSIPNSGPIRTALLQNTDWVQKIISLLLKIRKEEYQYRRTESRYHSPLCEKQEKAYNEIFYKIGWPHGFGNFSPQSDQSNLVVQFENNLYLSIPPHKSTPALLTPELIKQYWSAINSKLNDKDCLLVWKYFKKFSYKLESSSTSYRPLCCVSIDDNGNELRNYELKYISRTKKWETQICSHDIGRDTLFLFKQTVSESGTYIRKEEIISYIFYFCGKSLSGLRFWSHYITDEISRTGKPNLFILYLNDDTEQDQILEQLDTLRMKPNLVNKAQDLSSLLAYGMTPDIITAIPYMDPNKSIAKLIQKLLTSQTIEIPTTVSSIKLKYKCKKSVLIFCKQNKSPDDLKLFCQVKNIHVYEAVWSGFSTESAPSFYPLLPGGCDGSSVNRPIPLTPQEIAYTQWMLFIAKYHINKQVLPLKQTSEEILSKFMDKFCIVTGQKSDCYRSQDFYEQWVVDYYHQNNCTPIGYKRFNRFLKSYNEGQLYVKSIHKSTGDNVQHIIGLQFLKSEYEKMKAERVGNHIKKLQHFYTKLADLFDITEKEIQHMYQRIIETNSFE